MCKHRFLEKADHLLKDFEKRPWIAADLANGILYQGEKVISAEDISICDSEETAFMDLGNIQTTLERRRDVMVGISGRTGFFMGIENQLNEDKNMVIRKTGYDLLGYLNQLRRYGRIVGQIITLVLYFGDKEWSGPKSLSEMIGELPFEGYLDDWDVKIIQVKDLDENLFECRETKDLIKGIKALYHWNGDEENIKEIGLKMDRDIALIVARVTGNEKLLEVIGSKKKGEINMSESLERCINNAKERSMKEGMIQGIEQGMALSLISLMEHGISLEKAMELLNIPSSEYSKYMSKIA